jgi:dolichol-phosphate mannosyltransferase
VISILTPAFNESANLAALHSRIVETMDRLGEDWEWLIVDDHSRDDTFAVVQRVALVDPRVRGIRLARNSGSHVAITCGLHHVRGTATVMMAADLQDPPETLSTMLGKWREGAQVVWAVRRERPGDTSHAGFAAVYYWIMRHVVGMKEMPARGADFFLADRAVVDAFCRCDERNTSVFALITWLGFRQTHVEYEKQPRIGGRSGWTLARKIKLVVDSITAFSEAPIRACSYLGVLLMAAALLIGVAGAFLLPELAGGMLLLLGVIVGFAGLQLVALGVVGEYVWRALDEARGRPQYLIEDVAGVGAEPPSVLSTRR